MEQDYSRDPLSFSPLTWVVFEILLALADEERQGYAIMRARCKKLFDGQEAL